MKMIEQLLAQESGYFTDRSVLEIACGGAELTILAARTAKEVYCIDIERKRGPTVLNKIDNVYFKIMDACSMEFNKDKFDTAVIWNAVGHLDNLPRVISESMRVLKPEGVLLICASWKLDKVIMEESLLPFLDERHYSYIVKNGKFDVIVIKKL